MTNRVHDLLAEVAPDLARPSRKLQQLLDDAEREVADAEEVLAVGAGRIGVVAVPGVIVLTDIRMIGVSAGGQPRIVPLASIVSASAEQDRVRIDTETGDFVFSTPQGAMILDALERAEIRIAAPSLQHPTQRRNLSDPLSFRLTGCVVLGGSGPWDLSVGEDIEVRFEDGEIWLSSNARPNHATPRVRYEDLNACELSGRGTVTSGGGFIGGGFGVSGAVEGMAVAAVLNALTTKSSVETLLRLEYTGGEVFIAHTKWPPAQLRVTLSEVFMRIGRQQVGSAAGDLLHGELGGPERPS